MRWHWVLAVVAAGFGEASCAATLAAVGAVGLVADTVSKPHTFADGQVALAAQVNTNFDTLLGAVNAPRPDGIVLTAQASAPSSQTSSPLQNRPSSGQSPSVVQQPGMATLLHPLVESHESVVQPSVSTQFSGVPTTQFSSTQVSVPLHTSPSSQSPLVVQQLSTASTRNSSSI